MAGITATASTTIAAAPGKVWDALVTPAAIKEYMFGTTVVSEWREGDPIVWKGEWQGKAYEDKGVILELDEAHRLSYSHYSPLSGAPDVPESYHTVSIELSAIGEATRVELTQDNNATEIEREHAQQNWEQMLKSLKDYVEKS